MEKAPAFLFYAQDFLTGVVYLTNEEIGMYIKMLSKQWTDGKIPKKRLGLLLGLEWDSLSDELKEKFEDKGDYVVNTRLEEERNKKERFFEKQSENGKKGGRPKKSNQNNKPKINPNNNQKKPLENENENENENEIEVEHDIEVNTEKSIIKEKNKIEKIKFGDCVNLTQDEHDSLTTKHGNQATDWMINKLDNYKASSGKKYKSDYRAILSWVVDDYNKKQVSTPKEYKTASQVFRERLGMDKL